MERLIFAPIERIHSRYSSQWFDWFTEAFKREGIDFVTVGDTELREVKNGEFLDFYETNIYKTQQLSQIISIMQKNPKDSYTVFLMDAWFPGLEFLRYAAECAGTKLRICGMIHAGVYDPHDYLSRNLDHGWARNFERSLFSMLDEVFVATMFHANLIMRSYPEAKKNKFTLVSWPVKHGAPAQKENIVLFPHRLAPEKAPQEFEKLRERVLEKAPCLDVQFIRTKDVCKSKKDYYALMARAKVVFSSALQETFGIAMQEGINYGCIPVAPFRLSYPETIPNRHLYWDIEQAADMVIEALIGYDLLQPTPKYGEKITWANLICRKAI